MEKADPDAALERHIAFALQSEQETWTPDCLSPDQIIALAEHAVPEAEAVSRMAHVALCSRCRREFAATVELIALSDEVRALEATTESPPIADSNPAPIVQPEPRAAPARPPFWRRWLMPGVGFGFGAAAAAMLFVAVWNTAGTRQQDKIASIRNDRDRQVARADRAELEQTRVAKELAALRLNSAETAQLAGEVARLKAQEKAGQMRVARLTAAESALAQMPLPTPDWARSSESSAVRGAGTQEGPAAQIQLIRPAGAAVADRKPVLECRPVPGATDYRISLEPEGAGIEIAAPIRLSPTRWQVSDPLPAGRVYLWAVTAQRRGKQIRSDSARFYVLSSTEVDRISAARQKLAAQPLALGIANARYGLWADAARQFRRAMKSAATEPEAARRLKEIEEIEERRNGQ